MSSMSNGESLQFDRAEYDQTPSHAQCAECRRELSGAYYEVNGHTVCEACRYSIESRFSAGSSIGRFVRAAGAGFGAALAGAVLYYAILALTGYEIGLIAIAVGYAVGIAVRWGSNGRGGWKYQSLAMALTYFAIATGYFLTIVTDRSIDPTTATSASASAEPGEPTAAAASADAIDGERKPLPRSVWYLTAFVIAFAVPFLSGFENIIGLVIIGIGLYEAWKLNQRAELTISGPHMLGRPPQAAAGV